MKSERRDIRFPLWRKKVDSSLFQHNGTTIPNWACKMWNITEDFSKCSSKKDTNSKVTIFFKTVKYEGWVTIASKGRKTPAYRLWYGESLKNKLKDVFLMSFVRDIEDRLRDAKRKKHRRRNPFLGIFGYRI
jgi:hypothetical protein